MRAAPGTDPYVTHSLIRLLPQVGRESGLSDRGGESLVAAGNGRQVDSFATKAKRLCHVDCDVAVDVTIDLVKEALDISV